MKEPFLDIKDADMLKSLNYLTEDSCPNLVHQVSITLLKIKLLLAVRAGHEGKDMLQFSQTFRAKIQDNTGQDARENGIDQVVTILKSHVKILYRAVNRANADMWQALLSPGRHLDARPSFYTHGGIQEMQMVLKRNYDAWIETPGAIEILEAILHNRDF